MTKYDSPYRATTLFDCDDANGFYYAISANDADDAVMSRAAYEVVQRTVVDWFQRPGVVCAKLNIHEQEVELFISSPCKGEFDHMACFSLPVSELFLSAAQTATEYEGLSPSSVSDMLRKLADQIDGKD